MDAPYLSFHFLEPTWCFCDKPLDREVRHEWNKTCNQRCPDARHRNFRREKSDTVAQQAEAISWRANTNTENANPWGSGADRRVVGRTSRRVFLKKGCPQFRFCIGRNNHAYHWPFYLAAYSSRTWFCRNPWGSKETRKIETTKNCRCRNVQGTKQERWLTFRRMHHCTNQNLSATSKTSLMLKVLRWVFSKCLIKRFQQKT